ncbi:DUF2080 family transposase-associated protein, partial [Candidatus Micrarchaeota archaeon]|nr:DUF2080 family transposase-associated protein [Candidatus Micrarchaeota archaeon]
EVVRFGNGSIVYTPKKWIGKKVLVILEERPLDVKGEVMEILKPHLESVKGVFLHGSFARNEQTSDSDVDVLVVSDKKFKLGKAERFDFTVIDEETLRKELKGSDPFYIYSVLKEAKPILNEELLKELREIKINKYDFKWLLEESESALKIAEEFLKLDKLQKRKKLDSIAIIYTMILRLRRLFLVKCLLKNKDYSNKEFRAFLNKKGLSKELVEDFYDIYRAERDERKTMKSVSIEESERLCQITNNEINEMKGSWKKWRQKRKH